MAKQRVFVSFDYDNDLDVKTMLIGQALLPDSPFEFTDGSIKEHLSGDWQQKARARIDRCDQVIVLCGTTTHTASGVAAELAIAQQLKKPYFLLWGRPSLHCTKPSSALASDTIYKWTWDNLKALLSGAR